MSHLVTFSRSLFHQGLFIIFVACYVSEKVKKSREEANFTPSKSSHLQGLPRHFKVKNNYYILIPKITLVFYSYFHLVCASHFPVFCLETFSLGKDRLPGKTLQTARARLSCRPRLQPASKVGIWNCSGLLSRRLNEQK